MKVHMDTHNKSKTFKCDFCDFTTTSKLLVKVIHLIYKSILYSLVPYGKSLTSKSTSMSYLWEKFCIFEKFESNINFYHD